MKEQRPTEASSAKRKIPGPKLEQRKGRATRKTETGVKRSKDGGVYAKRKPDVRPPPTPLKDRKGKQKKPTVLEVQIFEAVDESKLSIIESRCLMFVREFCQNGGNVRQAAVSLGIPLASAMTTGMRYFRHEFTQKLLRENMLDISRDRKALSRMILQKTLEEAEVGERYQEMGSHRARIAALELASKMLGLQEKTVNIKGKGGGPIGIMVIPQAKTREEWETEVTQRQAKLQTRASNDEPTEKSVL